MRFEEMLNERDDHSDGVGHLVDGDSHNHGPLLA